MPEPEQQTPPPVVERPGFGQIEPEGSPDAETVPEDMGDDTLGTE